MHKSKVKCEYEPGPCVSLSHSRQPHVAFTEETALYWTHTTSLFGLEIALSKITNTHIFKKTTRPLRPP